MTFEELKISFFDQSKISNNIVELIKSFSTEFTNIFRLRNNNPNHIFDNLIGKYIAFVLLVKGLKPKDFQYVSYWLENEDFLKMVSQNNLVFKDIDPIHIEYSFKYNINETFINQYHIDDNIDTSNQKIQPLMTSLIYLSDSIIPTLILDKELQSIGLCFPEYLKTVIFDGGKNLHGSYNDLFDNASPRPLIIINIYNKELKYTPYLDIVQMYQVFYIMNKELPVELPLDIDIKIQKNDPNLITNLEINSSLEQFTDFCNLLNRNDVNDICYKKYKTRILAEIKKYIDNNIIHAFQIKVNTNIQEWILYDTSRYDDIDEGHLQNDELFDEYHSKYKNVFLEKSILSRETCDWLIQESNTHVKEKYGEWKNDRHVRYPTYDISIDKLSVPVMNYILIFFMKNIGGLIYNRFNISSDNYDLNIVDAFIVKYEEDKQRSLDFHCDDSHMSALLLLSNENSFTGGGTQFDSGLSVYPNQGDILLFGSKYKHQGLEINSGVRMVLTFFVDVVRK